MSLVKAISRYGKFHKKPYLDIVFVINAIFFVPEIGNHYLCIVNKFKLYVADNEQRHSIK